MAGAGLAGGLAVAGERALDGGGEEAGEQRVRAVRPRAELRVELRADHPGVVADLADLDERAVRVVPLATRPTLVRAWRSILGRAGVTE